LVALVFVWARGDARPPFEEAAFDFLADVAVGLALSFAPGIVFDGPGVPSPAFDRGKIIEHCLTRQVADGDEFA
jgi:hypothetical protein